MYGVSFSTAVGYHELPFWHEYISQNFFNIKNVFKKWFHFQWCKLEIQYIEVHGAISEEYILLWSLIVVVVFPGK